MKSLLNILLATILLAGCTEHNKIDPDRDRINQVCNQIMTYFQTGKVAEISGLLKSNSSLIGNAAIDTLQRQILDQTNSGAFSQYGKSVSYELVREINVGNFTAKRIYALKYEHFFLTFIFTLYNSTKGWKITGFRYTEDSASIY